MKNTAHRSLPLVALFAACGDIEPSNAPKDASLVDAATASEDSGAQRDGAMGDAAIDAAPLEAGAPEAGMDGGLDAGSVYGWSKRLGDYATPYRALVDTDNAGNVIFATYIAQFGSIDLGKGPISWPTQTVIAKLDPDGKLLFERPLTVVGDSGAQNVVIEALAYAPNGAWITAGAFRGSVDFGGCTMSSSAVATFVVRYDNTLAAVSCKQYGTSTVATGVSVDGVGNTYLVATGGAADFGGGSRSIGGGMAVAKFDGNGAWIWDRVLATNTSGPYGDVAVDKNGDVLIASHMDRAMDIGTGTLPFAGGNDIFVARLAASNGATMKAKSFGGALLDYVNAIAYDGAADEIVIGGSFSKTIDFGTGPMMAGGSDDAYLARFDAQSLNAKWAKRYGSGRSTVTDLRTSGAAIYAFLEFASTIDLGCGPASGKGVLRAELDALGTCVTSWGYPMSGQMTYARADSIAVDAQKHNFVAGRFGGGSIDFGYGPLSHQNAERLFLAALP